MPTGISGSNGEGGMIGSYTPDELQVVELRVISNLLQAYLAANGGLDGLGVIRNDQAFELSLPTPLPGAGM